MKNRHLIIVLGIIAVVLGVLVIFTFFPNDNPSNNTIYSPENILGTQQPVGTETPINNNLIPEALANEPIINDLDSQNTDARQPSHIYENETYVPENEEIYDYASHFLDPYIRDARFVSHYGLTWENDNYRHPVANSTIMFMNSIHFNFEQDPNEKKEEVIYIVDSFRKEYTNIIYQSNVDIKNMLDIPDDGLYILAEEDEGWYSLRITKPFSEDENYFYIYLTGTSKKNQLVRGTSNIIDAEIERIENILDLVGIEFDWNIVIRDGAQYRRDTTHDKPKDPEDYTPEDEMLLTALGIF